MSYKVTLVGAEAHEQTPNIAVYSLDASGRVTGKIAVVSDGKLDVSDKHGDVVAIGPSVENLSDLDPKGLVTLQVSQQLAAWNRTGEILIPPQWWRGWLGFRTCVSGSAYRCFPFLLEPLQLRAIGLGQQPIIFPERCQPLCNAVVEIWEYTTCCWPFLLVDVPKLVDNLAAFLADNPIMFPVPPRPNGGPVELALAKNVNAALGAGKLSTSFAPSSTLSVHLETLRSLDAQDAVSYIEEYPVLWPFWCVGDSAMLAETPLNPDGSFSYCYWRYPFLLWNCRTSYFYKVKQLVNGVWTYVYDGAEAHQYFTADEVANLYTLAGQTCFQPPILSGNDYIALQAIGWTNTYDLNSHWGIPSGGVDTTQVGDTSMLTPLPQDAGLVVGSGAPWATTLSLLLNYDSALQSATGPYYYRLSAVQADSMGNPMSGATKVTLMTPVSWQYFAPTNPVTIASQSLGPVTVGGNAGLYQIPYPGGANPNWLGNQFHQVLDTTQLANVILGGPGVGNGRFLLILEVFDKNGVRLISKSAPNPGPGSTDKHGTFNYVRLMDATTTANVPWASLTHTIWVDNRSVVAAIEYFMNSTGVDICQFYKEASDTPFVVGFEAYHAVMCDSSPSPVPTDSFMNSYSLTWQEGLGGTSGTLASGGDANWCNDCSVSVANAKPSPGTVTFGEMLGTDKFGNPLTACSFAITLNVYAKHTNGVVTISAYDAWSVAAVALAD
jgi:hypothetical protein